MVFEDSMMVEYWPTVVGCMLSQPVKVTNIHVHILNVRIRIHQNPSNPSTIPKMFQAFSKQKLEKEVEKQFPSRNNPLLIHY